MTAPRARWNRLGFRFQEDPTPESVELEATIFDTLGAVRDDSRLFWGAATWLHRYGSLVDGRRLGILLDEVSDAETISPILAALLVASKSPHLKGLLKRCTALPATEPLFHVRGKNPAGLADLTERALPTYLRWGFLLADEILKPDALRPTSWVLRENPDLLTRALLGADLRAEVFNTLRVRDEGLTASELARHLDRSSSPGRPSAAASSFESRKMSHPGSKSVRPSSIRRDAPHRSLEVSERLRR